MKIDNRRKYLFNFDFFKKESRDLAYFLGFFMADGHIPAIKSCIRFQIHEKDIEILEYLKLACEYTGPIVKFTHISDIGPKNGSPHVRLIICSCDLVRLFNEGFNIPLAKTGNEIVPKIISDLTFYDFVRGLFDGDGHCHIEKNGRLHPGISCSNDKFLLELWERSGRLGSISPQGNLFKWGLSGTEALIFRDKIYDNESFALKRKKDLFFSPRIKKPTLRRITYEEELKIQELIKTKTVTEVSKEIGLNYDAVWMKCKDKGWLRKTKQYTGKNFSKDDELYIIDNYNKTQSGKSIKEICITLNRSRSSINHKLKRMGLL